ncbi:hypothetical protein [Litorilituus lipolyticus]|uniref:Uncharacterized protein n=1 Tax=Litorilituus lipolyticus TaxID=2491017 RepID=A0A502KST0_9GAMM|nr:hypothetical protein [Litorilituus lipolyticus]TPH14224.1 hypothetical protein EPA86_11905 [Litorilituus lipolyticus]
MKPFNLLITHKNKSSCQIRFVFVALSIALISSLSACSSIEKIRSDSLFEQYCYEEGRVGQFIYERVALGEEYFRPIPTDEVELRRTENGYYIDNRKLLIDKERFKQSYTRNFFERKVLSPIGPIYSVESTLVRKSDGRVLSKAVSLLNMQGRTRNYVPIRGIYCPIGQDSNGNDLSHKYHLNLIENTFYKQ